MRLPARALAPRPTRSVRGCRCQACTIGAGDLKDRNRSAHPPDKSVSTPAARQFVPVNLGVTSGADHNGAADRYVLTLGGGMRLELPGLPSPQWLAQVRQALVERVR